MEVDSAEQFEYWNWWGGDGSYNWDHTENSEDSAEDTSADVDFFQNKGGRRERKGPAGKVAPRAGAKEKGREKERVPAKEAASKGTATGAAPGDIRRRDVLKRTST